MYPLILLLGLSGGGLLVWRGIARHRSALIVAGALLAVITIALFVVMSIWGEALWYVQLGQGSRFWRMAVTRVVLVAAGAIIGFAWVFLLVRRWVAGVIGAVVGVLWWLPAWQTVLPFLFGEPTGQRDPIFKHDMAFYLFALPFYGTLVRFLLVLTGLALAAIGARLLTDQLRGEIAEEVPPDEPAWKRLLAPHPALRQVSPVAGVMAVVLVAYLLLAPYGLLQSDFGAVYGAGWTDVWVRRPGYYISAAVAGVVAVALLIAPLRRRIDRWIARRPESAHRPYGAVVGGCAVMATCILGVWIVPGLFQWLKVRPNELAVERPFIVNNIEFTRRGFGLDRVRDRAFPASDRLTAAMIASNQHILSEIRLWDPRALDAVYRQFQEIRLYYDMDSVDVDRYTLGDRYRQVMVAAREVNPDNLPKPSQTFVNRRFKYTHGYGIAMSPVNEFRVEGLPEMFVKDIPPRSTFPELEIDRPEIYFGEATRDYVVGNSREREFDYPSGDENVYVHYAGKGGVPVSSFWRRLVYGWKLDGTKLLMSKYLTPDSRVLFHRQVKDRVSTLAPFLAFDEDPYIVVADGRLYWILDGYTISNRYPYSRPFSDESAPSGQQPKQDKTLPSGSLDRTSQPQQQQQQQQPERTYPQPPRSLEGSNYIRNSVKAVVDAYDGTVALYVFDADDPIVKAWSRAFPSLFKPRASMPASIRAHVRYPEGLLLAQSQVYAKYHMTDPEVFYNQEDLWVRATEKYYDEVRPVDPYYIMWEPTGSGEPQFVLMQPFAPKNRQVLIGWIAGMCDEPNYGRLLAYHFPKEKRVLGTQQVDTKIDQDRELSGQLTLWNQQGKRVIRGNVVVIPLDDTLLYVEPIYIQADVAAYPELRLVVVMHNDHMSYAPSFQQAIAGLLEGQGRKRVAAAPEAIEHRRILQSAASELDGYLKQTSQGRFVEAAKHLERLQSLLSGRTRM